MKINTFVPVLYLMIVCCCSPAGRQNESRTYSFDEGWSFIKADPPGAEDPGFDDSDWRKLNLPHDWSIEDLPDQGDSIIGPFSKSAIGMMSTGYTVGGTAWYRKTFTLDKGSAGKKVYVHFDGVYMNADVWMNGEHLGTHPYGYTSFYFDVTPWLNPPGEPNVVAVQVKNEGQNSRWYSGSGIYRHTWLTVADKVHIGVWGVYITTPFVSADTADIELQYTVVNSGESESDVLVSTEIADPSGRIVAKSTSRVIIPGNDKTVISQIVALEDPELWSVDSPSLYQARVSVTGDGKDPDIVPTTFGIRSIAFTAEAGFSLNGQPMEIRGGCFHHDNGPLGSAIIDRAEERKIELLKKAGYNAIRCSHNPPSPQLLDACDRLGMLVIDEAFDMWARSKNPDDYSNYFTDNWKDDLTSMVLRDRNHPSVIMWSIGNEIPEAREPSGLEIATELTARVRELDTTRAVTEALVDFMGVNRPDYLGWDDVAPHMALLDVAGYNYGYNKYEADHEKYPDRIMYASESMPALTLPDWQMVEKLPYVFGSFTWTAMDYLGEAGVGVPRLIDDRPGSGDMRGQLMHFFNRDSWPVYINFQGDLDLTGNPKAAWYYRQVVWRESNVEVLVHRPIPEGKREITSPWGFPDELKSWNWEGHEGEKMLVHVYSRGPVVRLELNGKVIGEQTVDDSQSITATFEVPYEAGELTARTFKNSVETGSQTIKTTGKPAAIRLVADRNTISAHRNDLSYVMVEIIDSEGNVVPDADGLLIEFEITGDGEIAGVGNGSPDDMASFQQPARRTWQGRCLAIIRPSGRAGTILLKAESEGLQEDRAEIVSD